MFRPLWIEVNLKKLRNNFNTVKKAVGNKVKVIATVKQSAYGHGLIPVAQELTRLGVDSFGVGSIEEAVLLREHKLKQPILVLTAVLPAYADEFIRYGITPAVVDWEFAQKLDRAAARRKRISPVHVKIDTGMGRLGLHYKDAGTFLQKIANLKNIFIEGIYTHFPSADSDRKFTQEQIVTFDRFLNQLKKQNIRFQYSHCANSAGVFNYQQAHFNMVRPGLVLYGINPLSESSLAVEPIISLKSKIVFIKNIKKGMSVSYGRTYVSPRDTRIAIVAVGYADGYPWALSNNATVIIKDKLFPLVGRVCMDHIMVDLGVHENIAVGDEVILIGESKNHAITPSDLASWAKTIPYEITTRLSLKLPRVYKNGIEKIR